MKITLKKDVQLHSAVVYLRFQKEELREDIQEYLNGKSFEPLIENRIKDYLKNIGIYDERFQLTKLGNKAKNTGKIFVSEEGKYQIWFTKEDSFFDSKIFISNDFSPLTIRIIALILLNWIKTDIFFYRQSKPIIKTKPNTQS